MHRIIDDKESQRDNKSIKDKLLELNKKSNYYQNKEQISHETDQLFIDHNISMTKELRNESTTIKANNEEEFVNDFLTNAIKTDKYENEKLQYIDQWVFSTISSEIKFSVVAQDHKHNSDSNVKTYDNKMNENLKQNKNSPIHTTAENNPITSSFDSIFSSYDKTVQQYSSNDKNDNLESEYKISPGFNFNLVNQYEGKDKISLF